MNNTNTKQNRSAFTIQDLYEAYRKLKSYFYYDNTSLFIRKQIAEFEYENFHKTNKALTDNEFKIHFETVFSPLLNMLNSDNPEDEGLKKYTDKISYKLTPKTIERKSYGFITNKPQLDNLEVAKCNFLIDAPIEVHIISVLWLMYVGKYLNSKISSDNYAYQLLLSDNSYITDTGIAIRDESKEEADDSIANGLQLYKPYFIGYQQWRDNALKKALALLDDKKDATILSLDIKRYFYSVRLSLKDIYDNSIRDRTLDKDDKLANKLCGILQAINWQYTLTIKDLLDDEITNSDLHNQKGVLPIGLLSSGFLGNYYLNSFDKQIIDNLNPAYYGRYVDDILFVFSEREIDYKSEDPVYSFIYKYFVEKEIFNIKPKSNNKNKEKTISGPSTVEFEFKGKPNLLIQRKKVILEDFSHKESRAAINQFKINLEKQRSEFRFLPDEEKIEHGFDNEAFLLQYSDSVNKLRSIDEYREDKLGASKFLASKIFLSCYSNEKDTIENRQKFNKSSQQILSFFKGRIALDFHTLWEKVATYFIINNEMKCLNIFTNQVEKSIKNIKWGKDCINNPSLLEKLKNDLEEFLKISVSIPLSMNMSNEDNVMPDIAHYFRYSNMFRHNLVGISAINFTSKLDDLNYNLYNMDMQKIVFDSSQTEQEETHHLSQYLSPRFVHFNELNVLEVYRSVIKSEPENVNSEETIRKAFENYKQVNYKWRYLYSDAVFSKTNDLYNINRVNIKKNTFVNEICIHNPSPNTKTNKKVAIANIRLFENDTKLAIKGTPNTSKKRRQKIFNLINAAVKENCDILVLPELAIPFAWLDLLAYQSHKNNLAIISGLEYFIDSQNNACNFVATILPIHKKKISTSIVNLRLKNHYSPHEVKTLRKSKHKIPKIPTSYDLFHWQNCYFSVYNCFELADIEDRSLFKSKVDFLVATEWNKDVPYFSDVIASWVRDLHCYLIQVNTSHYGDSRIVQPTESVTKNLISVKGGLNAVILVDNLKIAELREFQFLKYNLQEKDKRFKLTPPSFSKKNVQKRMNNKSFWK